MLGRNLIRSFSRTNYTLLVPARGDMDCLDADSAKRYITDNQPDLVMICAGLVGGISANIASPYEFFKDNMQIGINVIDACVDGGVDELINISSINVYPDSVGEAGCLESDILAGKLHEATEGYGLAKGCTAKFADYASRQFDVAYRSIILSNLYGRFDSFSDNKAHMIPAIIRRLHEAAVSDLKSVEIWGDGLARRGFLFAEDVADFIVGCSEDVRALPQNLNIVPNKDYSVYEYNKIAARVVKYSGDFYFNKSMPVGSKQKLVNGELALSLGWAEATSIEDGILKTYKYFLETLDT